ncbi:hypothetical protein VE03_02595 [Pseudogymnoascus sp. 23342-1-I1]|nr:hypothetical protein VE03_02595 [Pseudogymnoascus sp. 23342-1-I1]
MRDGYINTSRAWWPSGATGKEPLVVWYHGGGFCLGDAAFEEELCQRLCRGLNAVLVSVNYRLLAPDYPFPTPINDYWDSLQLRLILELRVDKKSGFILSGSSVGGNICAVLSHLARDAGNINITGVYLGMPIVVRPRAVPEIHQASYRSYEENKDAPCLSQADLQLVIGAYNPDSESPLYSALLWPNGHADLPPTYFQKLAAKEARKQSQARNQAQKQLHRAGIEARKQERLRKKSVAQLRTMGLPIPPELEDPITNPEAESESQYESASEGGSGSGRRSGSERE